MLRQAIFAFCLVVTALVGTAVHGQYEVRGAYPERRIGGSNPEVTV